MKTAAALFRKKYSGGRDFLFLFDLQYLYITVAAFDPPHVRDRDGRQYWQLLNNGEQGEKNYTSVVPWMESLLFTQSANQPRGPGRDHEVSGEW